MSESNFGTLPPSSLCWPVRPSQGVCTATNQVDLLISIAAKTELTKSIARSSLQCSFHLTQLSCVLPNGRNSNLHRIYDCYCYLPLYVFCGRHLLAARLRPANRGGAAGALEEVARIVRHIRQRWPETRIVVRADSGFAEDALMAWCEAHRVDFILGLQR